MAKKATGTGKVKAYGYDFKPVRKSVGGVRDSMFGGDRPAGIGKIKALAKGGVKGVKSRAKAKGAGRGRKSTGALNKGLTIGSRLR